MKAEVIFLGTGGSVATPVRDNTSLLLRSGEDVILVDCPGSLIQKLGKLRIDPRRVRTILLTHVHPDHVYGLPAFIHSLMLEEGEIQFFASARATVLARRLLDLFELREKEIKTRVRFKSLRLGKKIGISPSIAVKPFPVPHHPSSVAYHFYFKEERKELIFSGDTPVHPPLFEEARGIDWLIHDSSAPSRFFRKYPALRRMHTSALDLGWMSQKASVKGLVPIHFLGEVSFSPAEIEREIRQSFRGRLIIPEDLQRLKL
ncbi:MAG: MBL fold metallo-hydrolase [Clostridiales bacterium]|nr:MBL fold metallo-hydrolase [Clostridiales bacterium]